MGNVGCPDICPDYSWEELLPALDPCLYYDPFSCMEFDASDLPHNKSGDFDINEGPIIFEDKCSVIQKTGCQSGDGSVDFKCICSYILTRKLYNEIHNFEWKC